jgi:steroid delta-isomerase-like uncharacterized protein
VTETTAQLRPEDPSFAAAWSQAWSSDAEALVPYYAPDCVYVDVAMGTTWHGRDGLRRFYRHMSNFISDNEITFDEPRYAAGGQLTAEWVWSGVVTGPIQLPGGHTADITGRRLSCPGVAVCSYDSDGLITNHRDYWDVATLLSPAGITLR